jgi:hypothetical protein
MLNCNSYSPYSNHPIKAVTRLILLWSQYFHHIITFYLVPSVPGAARIDLLEYIYWLL